MAEESFDALILDFGDVLTWPQRADSVDGMARLADVPLEAFRTAYWQHRGGYDGGALTAEAYWRRVLTAVGRPSAVVGETVAQLIALDIQSWTHYREEMWDLAHAAKASGLRTAILSNCPPEILARIRAERRTEGSFDAVVASCEVGCNKPVRRIYEACLVRLGVAPERAMFVDDRPENLEGAAVLGLRTQLFAGDDPAQALRRRLGGASAG